MRPAAVGTPSPDERFAAIVPGDVHVLESAPQDRMRIWLAPAHFALLLIILVWDVVLAGRIAQLRQAPRAFQALCGLCALLVAPALLIALATTTIITGRAVA